MRQQLLLPPGNQSAADVVRRLGAVQAQHEVAAELSIRARQESSRPGQVAQAVAEGTLIKTFAFRGATHLLAPEDGGAYLALRAASRMWELPSWQSYYGLAPSDWPRFRAAVREALAAGPITWDELGAALTARPEYRHLEFAFREHAATLLKPLAWQGDMSFGPPRNGTATFQRLDGNPHWAGIPDLETAGSIAVEAYFRAYGPATPEHVHYWLGNGLGAGRKRIESWLASLGDRLAAIEIDGETARVLREDLDDLTATSATNAIRLLPARDQWIFGPGTADVHVVPPARRTLVNRQANIVIAGGRVCGTWSLKDDDVAVTWFNEAGRPDLEALTQEVARLSTILDRPLRRSQVMTSGLPAGAD